MKKIIGWSVALAILGAVLALKGATVDPGRLTTGVLGGALLGFLYRISTVQIPAKIAKVMSERLITIRHDGDLI
jgi:hypothetical protein